MDILNLRLDEIKPYEKNPRNNDNAVDAVAASIREFGFKVPIIIDKDNVIVAGHTRYKAATKLGLKEVPCIKADDLNEEQIKAFRLADNKVSEQATWDFDLLNEELFGLTMDMEQFGFDMPEEEEENKEIIEDEAPEPPAEPKSKLGQIYQLGNHRLMCGDSTNEEDVAKLMNGVKADMVFTDPPYGMKKESDGVANDNLNYDDLLKFNKLWIPLTFNFLKNVGSWYCWGTDEPLMDIYSEILKPMKKQVGEMKLTFRNLITWDKGNGFGQLSADYRMYPIADEKCLFVMRGRQTYGDTIDDYWEGFEPIREAITKLLKDDLNLTLTEVEKYAGATTVSHWFAKSQWEFPAEERLSQYLNTLLSIEKISRQEFDKIRQEWYNTRAYFDNTHDNMNDVWHFPKTAGAERESAGGHATPKPIALCARAIKSSSRENENVLDVFGGSGSTLIACEQTNRKAYLMELEPQWVDVIIQRWENFTGKKAQLISEEERENTND